MVDQLTYRQQSRRFLAQAFQELQQGDLRQASEKGWGAAAQIVKAIPQERDWDHNSHYLLTEAVSRLVTDTNDQEFGRLFREANALHVNFYEGGMYAALVDDALQQVTRFIEKVETLLPGS